MGVLNMKLKLVTFLLGAMISTNAISELVNDEAIAKAREEASDALEIVSKGQMKQQTFDLSKLPVPKIKYNGNLASSSIQIANKNFGGNLSEAPKKKMKVFISFSMPQGSLNRIVQQAYLIGRDSISLAINGLDKESKTFPETVKKIQELNKGTNVVIDIDPTAFERFGVKKVPAIVVYNDDPMYEAKCAVKGDLEKSQKVSEKFLGVYGDVSIDYALEYFLKNNPDADFEVFLKKHLAVLRGKK